MSLTSYRAAPPRDKPLHAFEKPIPTNLANAQGRRSIPSGGFLRRQPGQMPLGCERYVPTLTCFGKARERSFRDFMTVKTRIWRTKSHPAERSCQKLCKSPAFGTRLGTREAGEMPRMPRLMSWHPKKLSQRVG